MTKTTPGISDKNEATYLRALKRLGSLSGMKLLEETFGATREGLLKEVAAGRARRIPGRQNKRAGTTWRKRHRVIKESRRRNRPVAKHTLRKVESRRKRRG